MNGNNIHRLAAAFVLIVSLALVLQGCSTAQTGLSVGDPAPAFTLPDAMGGSVSLADYEGERPVLVYFHMAVG